MQDVLRWTSRSRFTLRRNSQRVTTSPGNNVELQGRAKVSRRELEGLGDLKERAHNGYARLRRTSVRKQSTDKPLYN